jgi:Integrase core domain
MRDATLVRSISRKGCSPDNAACEGFFGWLKTELSYPRDWRATTVDQSIETLDAYIRVYNIARIKVSLGSLILWNTGKVSGSRHKPVQDFSRPSFHSAQLNQSRLCCLPETDYALIRSRTDDL